MRWLCCGVFISLSAPAASDSAFVDIASGARHSCGITAEGAVHCWGRQVMGKGKYPLVSSTAYRGQSYRRLGYGTHQGFALDADNRPVCWGENHTGQCDVIDDQFTMISGADKHVCALTQRQSIHCWGEDLHMNIAAFNGGTYSTLDSGYFHTCGVDIDGRVDCFGCEQGGVERAVDLGQCDSGKLPDARYMSVAAGRGHTCALTSAGEVDCIGASKYRQTTPPAGVRFRQIVAGSMHTCGIELKTGRAFCWGRDREGQSSTPAGEFIDIAAGFKMSCGLRPNGKVTCWGDASEGFTSPPPAFRAER